MKLSTRYYGAPYGRDGERGKDTTGKSALGMARRTLCAGQRMDCYRVSDEAQTTPVRRFVCSQEFGLSEVEL